MNNKLYILFGSIAASALMSGCVSRGNNPGTVAGMDEKAILNMMKKGGAVELREFENGVQTVI